MDSEILENTQLNAMQAYKAMFVYLDTWWEKHGKPDDVGDVLSPMALWETVSGPMEPMDGSILPEWIRCVNLVLEEEKNKSCFSGADIVLDGKKPTIKVDR